MKKIYSAHLRKPGIFSLAATTPKVFTYVAFILLSFIFSQKSMAQGTMGRWEMCGLSGTPGTVSPTGVLANVTFSSLSRGGGLTVAAATNGYSSTGWSTATTLDIINNDYYEFTITPTPGFKISITSLKIRDQVSSTTSSFDAYLRYNDDAYASNLSTWTPANTSANNRTINLSGVAALQNRATPVTFRIYGSDATASTTTYGIFCEGTSPGNFRGVDVDGTVSSIAYASQFISMNTGASNWCAGETRNVTVTVKNVGTATWTNAGPDVNIGVKWNTNGTSWNDYNVRVDANDLAPGATATYTLPVTASNNVSGTYTTPLAAGNNNLTFDIVKEGDCWFGNNGGSCGPGNSVFTSAAITINALPGAPTGTAAQTFCASASPTVANLTTTTGTTIKWYAAASGGTALATTTALVNGTHYYASQTSAAGCEGTARFDVTATISNPVAPTATAAQTFCAINNPTVANLTTITGTGIKWYAASTGGTALATTTALINGTHYYASQTVSGCEGINRFDVTATVNDPVPTGTAAQTFCAISSPTVANLAATGTTIKWYAAASGGTALGAGTALVNGTHYYASQTVSGCESKTRFDVTATVSNPVAPTGTAAQTFCTINNPTVADLTTATGTGIKWYLASSGGSALATTTALVNGTHYYASQTVAGCEGISRFDVTVTISDAAAPTGTITQTFCANESPTVADLVATGGTIKWYTASSGGSALATTTALVNGSHYYATQTVGGCESTLRLDVTALLTTIPTVSIVATENSGILSNDNIICAGGLVTFTATAGFNLYEFKVNGVSVSGPGASNVYNTTTLGTGQIVTVKAYKSLCSETSPAATAITVNALPAIPTLTVTETSGASNDNTICVGSSVTFTATTGGTGYNFKVDGSSVQNSSSNAYTSTTLSNGASVTVDIINSSGCTATSAAQVITVNALPSGTLTATENSGIANDNSICPGTNVTFTATGGVSYQFKVNNIVVQSFSATATYNSTLLNNLDVVTVDVINAAGCAVTYNPGIFITVYALPTITVTPASAVICAGLGTSLTASGASTYSWSPATGLSATTGATVTASPVSTTTYTVTGTNANGCVNSKTVTVTVNPLPIVSAASQVCIGSNITLLPNTGGTWISNNPAVATVIAGTGVVTGVAAGSVTFTFTNTATGCINTTSSVTVNTLPVVSAALQVCIGSNITLSPNTGGTWISNNPAVATVITGTGVVTGVASGSVTFTFTQSGTLCSNTTSAVTVNALPVVSAASTQVCIGSTIALSPTTGGTWISNNPAVATVNFTTGVVTGVGAGSATFTFTQTGTLCSSTTSSVTVNALPVVSAPSQVCIGSTINLSPNSGGTWVSNNPAVATVNATTGVVTGLAAGSVTFTFTNTATGCSNTTSSVTVNALPVLNAITGIAPVCVSSSITLSNTTPGGTGVWSSSNPAVATINASGVVTGVSGGTSTITYIFTNTSTGCTSGTTAIVTVNALPVPTLNGPNPICPGSTETYTTEAGQTNYTWVVTNGSIISGGGTSDTSVVVNWDLAGIKNITVNYTNANGCTGAISATILNVPSPDLPVITGPTINCEGSTGNVYTTQGGNGFFSNYDWVVTGGTFTLGAGDSTITVTWTTPGPGSVSVNFDNKDGCRPSTPTVYPVTVNPLTGATSFTAGATIVCQNAADVTYSATAANSTSIVYSVLPAAAGVINASTGVMNWDPAFSGTATIMAASTGLCGTTTANRIVTVNPSTGATSFIAGATIVCQDAADETYTATAANSTSIVYSVSPVGAGVINVTTGVMNWSATFSGTATITATSTGLCGTTTLNRIVTVNPSTGATSFTAGTTTVCQDAADQTYTATAANSTSIVYSVSPSPAAGVINPSTGVMNWAAAFSGVATITAISTGLCGTTTANRVVTVNPSTGATSFTTGATTVCQDAPDETYTATAVNSTSIVYSVLPAGAGVINSSTGVMNWAATFSGAATITATSTGLCGTTTVNRAVTVNPSTGATSFTAGATTVCQNAADQTYTAAAANSTSIVYSVSPPGAGVINATSGIMDWAAAFSGTATITATSTGLCGTSSASRTVIVNPSTGATTFTAGATTVCQDAADETYTAAAANSTSIAYSVLPAAAGVINSSTGVMNWAAAFAGPSATITATSTGLCGTTSISRTVTVNALPTAPSIPAVAAVCQNNIRTLTSNIAVIWSPITNLYTNAAATTAYTGTTTTTVYAKPTAAGSIIYSGTVTNGFGCSISSTVTLTVNPVPVVTVTADFCSVPGKVRLTATTVPSGASFVWSTGEITSFIDVDIANNYNVVATLPTGCTSTGSIAVAKDLVVNGDFSGGVSGFFTEYTNNQAFYTGVATSGLWPEGYYAVNNSAFSPSNGVGYHPLFHGRDHTTGMGNFMMVNGSSTLIGTPGAVRTIWQQTVNVLPNTYYYFSAWGMNLNPGDPAKLRFEVNGVQVGTIADLSTAPMPTTEAQVNLANWIRFYNNEPTWNSGSATTAIIRIVNLNTAPGGNDFGLDDISFGTLSTIITLTSATGTNAQTPCINTAITPIVYYVGGGTSPVISALPSGVTAIYDGVNVTISGTPSVAGTFLYSVAIGGCNPFTATGTITVQSQSISLTSGSSTQNICKGTGITNIVYTASGTATGATISPALPAGLSFTSVGNIYTLSGTPTVAGVYNYTITTTGTCAAASVTGTITVQEQNISVLSTSGNPSQSICLNESLANIVFNVGGTGTGASISAGALPAGVTATFNSGLFIISGTPTVAGVFNYTITTTTSGSCSAAPASVSGTITVRQDTLTLMSGNATQPVCTGNPIINIVYNLRGTATNATVSGLPTGVSGTYNAGVFTISGTPTQSGTFNFTVTSSGTCALATATATGSLTIGINTWTGTNGTNWSNTGNWVCGAVPVVVSDVVVPTGVSNMPQLTASSICRNLVLQAGTTLDLNGQDFTIYGTVTGTGMFKGSSASSVRLNAASAVSVINLDQTTDGSSNGLKTLTIAGAASSVTVNNKAVIYDALLPDAGTLTLNGELVLRSTSSATARLGIVTGSIAYTANGTVTVERFLYNVAPNGGRKWRLLAAPTNDDTQSIKTSWLENGVDTAISPKGYGFWAFDTRADYQPRGFDAKGNNTSIKIYNSSTDAWDAVANTTSPIKNNQGYIVFVPGDRKVVFPNSNQTTLRTKGKLYVGTQSLINTIPANQFVVIGNPYASRINVKQILNNSTGISLQSYFVWDPSLTMGYGLGAFNTIYRDVDGDYKNQMPSPLYGPFNTVHNDIESGLAFMVKSTSSVNSISINESDKTIGSAVASFTSGVSQGIRINLNLAGTTPILLDGAMANFDDTYSNQVDEYDIRKMGTFGESVGLKRNNALLVIERRFIPAQTDTLHIDMTKMTVRNYQWEINSDNMDYPGREAFLIDRYLNTSTALNLAGTTTVNFSIQNIPGSYAPDRFQIVFKISGSGPVPVTITTIAASRNSDKTVTLQWKVQNELNLSGYEVQRSVDGINFTTIITQPPANNNGGSGSYQVIDRSVVAGDLFYRIKANSISGQVQYSAIVKVSGTKSNPSISVYPNPVVDKTVRLQLKEMTAGTVYKLQLLNKAGQLIYTKSLWPVAGNSVETIELNQTLSGGQYHLLLTDEAGNSTKIILFVK